MAETSRLASTSGALDSLQEAHQAGRDFPSDANIAKKAVSNGRIYGLERLQRFQWPPRLVASGFWVAAHALRVPLESCPSNHDAVIRAVFRRREYSYHPFFLGCGLHAGAEVLIRCHATANDLASRSKRESLALHDD
jgi:hypothetical protein